MFPVSPDVLHGVKLRSISRQVLKADGAGLLGHKVFNQAATVGLGAIPNHQQLSFNVALKMGEKLNDLGASNTARMKLKVKLPPGNSGYRRKLLPVKTILQHRSLSFRRPRPTTVRPLAEPTLVNEHYRAPLALGFFLSSGQRRFFHCFMAGSSRSRARPVGRWQLQPSFFNNQLTCPAWYFTPKSRSISSATRSRVQRLVSYPTASAPRLSPSSRRLRSVSLNRDLRPARPACLSPFRPCSSICLAQRLTDWRCTPTCRATSASLNPFRNKPKALNRRRSKASKSLFTPAGFPMQVYLSQILPIVTIFYEYQ